MPHISDGLDLSLDSYTLLSSLPFLCGSLHHFPRLPGLGCPATLDVAGTLSDAQKDPGDPAHTLAVLC